MIRHDVQQNSDEWHRLRLGIPTSSAFKSIVTPKGKLSASADRYMHWLLAEWAVGIPLDSYESEFMQRGHELEDLAVKSYEFERGCDTEAVGFITTDDGMIGSSPDRLVGADGLLEIKCPAPQTHIGYMLARHIDGDYYPQVQGELLISGRKWVDIQSFHPGLPTVIIRVERDEKYLAILDEALREFVARILKARADLIERYGDFRKARQSKPKEQFTDADFLSDADVDALVRQKFPEARQ